MKTKVVSVLPSYYFPNCVVIETACRHKHVRPASFGVKVGDDWECHYDGEYHYDEHDA